MTVPELQGRAQRTDMGPIFANFAMPLWPGLLVLAPAAAWAVERGAARVDGGLSRARREVARGVVPGLAMLAAAWAIALTAALAFDGSRAWSAAAFGWVLLALARIDLATGLLPDRLTAPLALAGLAVAWFASPQDPTAALAGAIFGMAAGFASLAAVAWLYRRLRGRDGMGLGDAKLLGAAGAWIGAAALPLTVCVAATGALVAVLAARRFGWRLERDGAVPFGPFLCLAVWIVFLTSGDMLP